MRAVSPFIISNLSKSFTMHLRGGLIIPVVERVNFSLEAGKCTVLGGPSGIGKSSILKMLYGNYKIDAGSALIKHGQEQVNIACVEPRKMLEIRKKTLGYVSQFLQTVPRISALDIVAEPLLQHGVTQKTAHERVKELFTLLNLPEKLWHLPPATFSGGEQQRVNIARGFITAHPVLLLDEPTASLDTKNRQVVVEMIEKKKQEGVALLGIFHDEDIRQSIADKIIDVSDFAPLDIVKGRSKNEDGQAA